jgi:hypothetical protein
MADGNETVRLARRMRDRVEEIRNLAEGMRFAPARNVMLRLAVTYEKLAERRETAVQRPGGDPQRTT